MFLFEILISKLKKKSIESLSKYLTLFIFLKFKKNLLNRQKNQKIFPQKQKKKSQKVLKKHLTKLKKVLYHNI